MNGRNPNQKSQSRGRRKTRRPRRREEAAPVEWIPKTELGKKVKAGEITDISEILDAGMPIMEVGIVDTLVGDLETDLLLIGQAKGKFGGGKRRVFKQTQKKTKEGNKPNFATMAIVGNKNGLLGIGYGKAKETVPAREKAFRNAKLNLFKVRRGAGSWEDSSINSRSIPFAVEGKSGSVRIKLMPAPNGTGLIADKEVAKILKIAGIEDIRSHTEGQTKTKVNLIKATELALRKLIEMKIQEKHIKVLNIVEGPIKKPVKEEEAEVLNNE